MRKLISLITLLSFSVQAATITDDKLTVGKKASASAKEIVFDTNDGAANKKLSVDKVTKKLSATSDEVIVGDGTQSDKALTFNRGGSNAQVKWNELTDKLQFSNDGTTFKDLGTGGGGGGSTGVNVLTNDSFEDAVGGVLTDWSNTGGTLTQQTYTNSVEGDAKYFQFVATGAGQYFEMVKTVPTNFNGQGCQVDFKKLNIATADLFKVEALDASNNVLATGNVKVSSWQKFPTLSFACPAAGATFKIRVTSLAAGTLQGDKAYLGSNQGIINLSQARKAGESYFPGTASCTWTRASSTIGAFGATAACPGPTIIDSSIGTWLTTDSDLPRQTVNNLPPGTYRVSFSITSLTAAGTVAGVAITDGVTTCEAQGATGTNSQAASVISCYFTYSSMVNRSFELYGATSSATTLTIWNNSTAPRVSTSFQMEYFPSTQETAVSPEQASWLIDANIGGANPNMAAGSPSAFVEITNSSLDLVINTSKGSASAEIACASGTNSTGLTCPANESVGIAFVPGAGAGLYEVCAVSGFSLSSGDNYTFQLIETPNNSTTILQEGGQRAFVTTSAAHVMETCGTFNFSDTSKRTIRLMYESTASTSGSTLSMDRGATVGQRDMKWTVRPLLSAFNRPILTGDQLRTPGLSNPLLFSARVDTSAAISREYGEWLNTCSGTGTKTCTFSTPFLTTPNCWVESEAGSAAPENQVEPTTSTTQIQYTTNASAGGVTNTNALIFCHGVR